MLTMKTVKMIVHTPVGDVNVEIEAENNEEAVKTLMSERFYGEEQSNGDFKVIVTDNVCGITILGGAR